MSKNYFKKLRTVGTSLDEGIAKLEETWKMPQLLLHNRNNEENQVEIRKIVVNLRNELSLLKVCSSLQVHLVSNNDAGFMISYIYQFCYLIFQENVEGSKKDLASQKQIHTQFIDELIQETKELTEKVDEIKTLFMENGYVEELTSSTSALNSQLESLSVDNSNNSILKESDILAESSACDSNSYCDSPVTSRDSCDIQTPSRDNFSLGSMKKKSADQRPTEPIYSPYYYKNLKK